MVDVMRKTKLGRPRSNRTGDPRDVVTAAIRWGDISTMVSLAKLPEMRSGFDCDIRAAYRLAAMSEDRPLSLLLEDAITHYSMKPSKKDAQSLGEQIDSVMLGIDTVRRRTGIYSTEAKELANAYIEAFRTASDVIWRDVQIAQKKDHEPENSELLFRAALVVIACGEGSSSGKLLLNALLDLPLQNVHPPEHGKTMRELILFWYNLCVSTRTSVKSGRLRTRELVEVLGGYEDVE